MSKALRIALLAVLLALAAAAQEPAAAVTLDRTAYQAEMQRLAAAVHSLDQHPEAAATLARDLPEAWEVDAPPNHIRVPAGFLKAALRDFQKSTPSQKRQIVATASSRLTEMAATAFVATPQDSRARNSLNQVLARREFRGLHDADRWRELKQMAQLLLLKLLNWLFGHFGGTTHIGEWLTWAFIGIAVAVLGVWLYRLSQRSSPVPVRQPIGFVPSDKHWRQWMAEARERGSAGDAREAVHLAYWAGVSYLEALGAWRRDRARTPREYLRQLAAAHPQRSPFADLTREFEAIWYGCHEAQPADFDRAVSLLEQIGCR